MLTYEQVKEKELLYRTSEKAAGALYYALRLAETDEVCATDFAGSPKLYEITALKDSVKETFDRLFGARLVLMNLRLGFDYTELPTLDYKMHCSYWRLYSQKIALGEAAEQNKEQVA